MGPTFVAAGWVNAALGSAGAAAVHRLSARCGSRAAALAAGLAVALHPGLILYTPAVMTEGAAAALLAVAAWLGARARDADGPGRSRAWRLFALGSVLGAATLVRPQMLAIAPIFGFLVPASHEPLLGRFKSAVVVATIAVLPCLPWTVRNCVRIDRCALVSVNGGWNLLIGADERATGAWAPIDVPAACREVWGEADKDECFRREALHAIAASPWRWATLAPAKLAATFDYCGAAGYYLHESNRLSFGEAKKRALGVIETVYERLSYLGALLAVAMAQGPRRSVRLGLAAVGAVFLFREHAYVAILALLLGFGALGARLTSGPFLNGATFAALLATSITHAVFFGAGRYGMIAFPLVTAMAAMAAIGFASSSSRQGIPSTLTSLGARGVLGEPGRADERDQSLEPKKEEETTRCP